MKKTTKKMAMGGALAGAVKKAAVAAGGIAAAKKAAPIAANGVAKMANKAVGMVGKAMGKKLGPAMAKGGMAKKK